jgi:hypothetical protein
MIERSEVIGGSLKFNERLFIWRIYFVKGSVFVVSKMWTMKSKEAIICMESYILFQ